MRQWMKTLIRAKLQQAGYDIVSLTGGRQSRKSIGSFTDSSGVSFSLLDGYRWAVWPVDWNAMISERTTPSREAVRQMGSLGSGRKQLSGMQQCLEARGISFRGKNVLEVGCHLGSTCVALLAGGANLVVGLDVPAHHTLKSKPTDLEISNQTDYLRRMRQFLVSESELPDHVLSKGSLSFWDVDVTEMPRAEFDLILSWETFEHILRPQTALKRIYENLVPGGYSGHLYHPFFSENGGHFDCLDIPWGHVVLSSADVHRFMSEFHPEEVAVSDWRLNETINRMTHADLRQAVQQSGLELVELYPTRIQPPSVLPANTLTLGQRHWPTLTTFDLLGNYMFLLVRRPEREV